ncbi:hypothetical protein chiPu_0001265 [Chiloscyllium punctatum]|uniref:Uncharacterized protein n=1 Tax=Chiloscyllium punctatum TaxID=137246 RepID=A0A401RXI9_CHIPU|nr:hypothetical protein [Chiloscyllium punctatum]
MGTTASTSKQTASAIQAQCDRDAKPSGFDNRSEDINTAAGLAKSIITNKVAPVVITYNLKEEFQVHDDFHKAHYVIGCMNDNLPEHYLVQGKYFMVKDLNNKVDDLLTMSNYGAPNFRQTYLGYPVYGMGQPTMKGFCKVLQRLKEEGHQLLDFAALSNKTYFVYNDTEQFVTEALPKKIENEDDIRLLEEIYRYKRLPLPIDINLEEADFDAFISTVRVDSIMNICSEMYDLKEIIYLSKSKAQKLAEELQSQGLEHILSYLTDDCRKFSRVLCLNLREEAVLEGDGKMYSLREVNNLQQEIIIPVTTAEQLEEVETATKVDVLSSQNAIETWHEETKQLKQFASCNTLQEVYTQIATQFPQLHYKRIPITDCAAPREEGFPEPFVEDMVSIPDAKYTKGEFEAILNLVRLLPNGSEMKKEVDRALDAVSDSMTPMMHHLRELIINTYKKVTPFLSFLYSK